MSERIAPMVERRPSYGGFAVELAACLLSVEGDEPVVLVDEGSMSEARFPSVAFDPGAHKSLDLGVRDWLLENTGLEVGRLEQVHTARRSGAGSGIGEPCSALSIGFLGLVPPQQRAGVVGGTWRRCLDFMPWEDRRRRGGLTGHERVGQLLLGRLQAATLAGDQALERQSRRIRSAFGLDSTSWEETSTLERCALVQNLAPCAGEGGDIAFIAGMAADGFASSRMVPDHLQILAAALGRLRARLRVRPIAMDLVPPVFTLLDLQRSAEAILGPSLHKQNFRRYVEGAGVIEATGTMRQQTGGRPAQLFRFRRDGLSERRLASRRLVASGTLQRA
jgi:hypothetical protein